MGEKTAYERLVESAGQDLLSSDTRFNRLYQLAESDRRERVAASLVRLCTNFSELALSANRVLSAVATASFKL